MMNNVKTLKTEDRLRGFDSQRLQMEMTDDLGTWFRRREENTHELRGYLSTSLLMLLLAGATHLFTPTTNYRVGDGATYDEVALLNRNMLNG